MKRNDVLVRVGLLLDRYVASRRDHDEAKTSEQAEEHRIEMDGYRNAIIDSVSEGLFGKGQLPPRRFRAEKVMTGGFGLPSYTWFVFDDDKRIAECVSGDVAIHIAGALEAVMTQTERTLHNFEACAKL